MIRRLLVVLVATLPLLACGSSSREMAMKPPSEPAHRILETSAGRVLATNRGMTLYTFANDTVPGISMCNDACARNWPPLLALDDAQPSGKWSVVQRSDGLKQWAYGGKPLYGWHEDKRLGDVLGEGRANGAWTAARP
jgi:predicted lipoprotein with Yx(FWY)xxD motif